ncbi:unnamed protein product [Meloidogyne enterolobii]|uniref:Uncharacterized protein n=1 Tax=Meloidogyne enterolobii TaxID=390850 RepID=A0ACB1AIZ8_MELEN
MNLLLIFPLLNFLLLQFTNLINCQHQSFANTKFELPETLPEEEQNMVEIAANQDITPETQPPPPPTTPTPTPPPPTETTTELTTTLPTTTTTLPTTTLLTTINNTQQQKTPLPVLPNLVELPRFVERGNVQVKGMEEKNF